MEKVKYTCAACLNWSKAIPATWGDIRPKFCGNNTCSLSLKKGKGKNSFRKSPESLLVEVVKGE